MTTRYKTRAFVFKKSDVNETDRIFSVFTDDFGRLDIFAKAIRKTVSKLRSGVDIFFVSELEFIQGKNRKTLTDAITIKKFNNLYNNIEKFEIANKIGDILDNFMRGEEKEKEIFNLLNEVFVKLNDDKLKNKECEILYYYFLWNTLSLLGYKSEVNKCAGCQNKLIPYNVYFSSKEGGVVCSECQGQDVKSYQINSDIVKILRIILSKNWQMLSRLRIEPASRKLLGDVSSNYHSYILSESSFKSPFNYIGYK